jgi:hypothetical protein
MSVTLGKALMPCVAVIAATLPACANRLTIEVWPDPDPSSATFCSIALSEGWLTLVQVRGAGLPPAQPLRWRPSTVEEDAMTAALQAFLTGDLVSVDPYLSRLPPAPFVTLTWLTMLDGHMTTGLYIQSGLSLPPVLGDMALSLGVDESCGLTARAAE